MTVQVVLGLCCSQMSDNRLYDCMLFWGFVVHKYKRPDCMTVQVILGLCCSKMSE